jgi:glycosyltransferase involved in cell wall biosynthesis
MPTFEQSAFIARAVASLSRQSLQSWELVIVDDGSKDDTSSVVKDLLQDRRIRYHALTTNHGLGRAANLGLARARGDLVAYLPSDDIYYPDHLASLSDCIERKKAILAYSELEVPETPADPAPRSSLQLVQVMHRRTADRWLERDQLETDDLGALYFDALSRRGCVGRTGRVTSEWVRHPDQRHRAIRESLDGGLNVFRRRYRIGIPLRFRSSDGGCVDEPALYERFQNIDISRPTHEPLKILLVGELSYNPERIVALEEAGHELYGLWTTEGLGSHTIGPLPFGRVRDLPHNDWRAAARAIRPDVVYALLNWRAVPLAKAVLDASLGIPFVWHFKESPMRCLVRGTWPELAALCARSSACIFSTCAEKHWFDAALPGQLDPASLVLDGDLPKADWFAGRRRRRLSEVTGELHTVVLGRPLGIDGEVVQVLAAARIHLHLYGLVHSRSPDNWAEWLGRARHVAGDYVHVHPHVDQRSWVEELSQYDAAWLHRFRSANHGDVTRATWNDLNYPARIPPYLAAGLPLLQQVNPGSRVAAQELIAERGIGLLYHDLDDLCAQLNDPVAMARRRGAVRRQRLEFTFDHNLDRLVNLFRAVAA